MNAVKFLLFTLMGCIPLYASAALEALPDEALSEYSGQSVQFSHFTGAQISDLTTGSTLANSLIGVDDDHYTRYTATELNNDGYGDVHFYRIGINLNTTLNATIGDPDLYSEYANAILEYYQNTDTNLEDGDNRTLPNWDQVYEARYGTSANPDIDPFGCLPYEAACRGLLTNYSDKSNGLTSPRTGTYSDPGYDGVNRPNLTTVNNPDNTNPTAEFETSPDYDPQSTTDAGSPLDYDSMSNLDLEGVETSDLYVEFAVKNNKLISMRTGVGLLQAAVLRALNLASTGPQTAILNTITIVHDDGTQTDLNQFANQISFNSIGKQVSEVLCQNLVYSSTSDPCSALADVMGLPSKNIDNIDGIANYDGDNDGNLNDDIIIPYFALVAANASYYTTKDLSQGVEGAEGIKGLWFSSIYDPLTEISKINCVQCTNRDNDSEKEGFRWYDQTGIGNLGTYTAAVTCGPRQQNCTPDEESYTPDTPTDIDFKGSSLHIKGIPLNLVTED